MSQTGHPTDTATVAALLQDPETHDGAKVERIDTHGAIVFLAGDRAYKLKRAVRYPYMDYSSLDRRRACCAAEVRLNRRTAPSLYLGVMPVVGSEEALELGPLDRLDDPQRPPQAPQSADVREWLVVMRQFGRDLTLDALADRHMLSPEIVAALSQHIAAFHADAPASHAPRLGAPALRQVIEDNLRELAASPMLFPPRSVAQLRAGSQEALGRLSPLLDERLRAGLVRRCHGDLHLRNVCLLDGKPVLFDALEFDEDLATIDVLYDFGFLIMDLEQRGLRPLAHLALQRYLEDTVDLEGLAALPLFVATRAAVRAKVSASMASVQASRGQQREMERDARFYLAGALDALRVRTPRFIMVGGPSGSGKTTLAANIAPHVDGVAGAFVVRSDVVRKRLAGVSPTARLGDEHYSTEATARTYEQLRRDAARVLEAGHSVIVDATFTDADQRARTSEVAAEHGLQARGLWMEADPEVLRQRVSERRGDVSDAGLDVLEAQLAAGVHRPPAGEEAARWDVVPADGAPDEVARRARAGVLGQDPAAER